MEDAMDDTLESIIVALKTLESTSGELWQYEALASSMRRLADQKRAELLSANVATNIMERLFSEPDAPKRALLAEELRRETLRRLHDIRWTLASNNDRDLAELEPIGRQLVQVYSMLNACVAIGESLLVDEEGLETIAIEYLYDPGVCFLYVGLEYDHDYLIDQLVNSRLISKEDSDLLRDMLAGVTLPYESDVLPNWIGSMRSLVTFVVLGYEFGVFDVKWKNKYQRSKDYSENSPNLESAIINSFQYCNKKPSTGISRDYIKPIRASAPVFRHFMKGRHPRAVKGREVVLLDSDRELDLEVMDDYLSDKFPDLDVTIMQIYDDLLERSHIAKP